MIRSLILADVRKSRVIAVMLTLLMALSTFLAATGTALIFGLTGALDGLYTAARTPDVVQMHAAPFDDADQRKLEDFAEARTDVTGMQVQRMLGVDKTSLFYEGTADLDDTQDNALVVQTPTSTFCSAWTTGRWTSPPGKSPFRCTTGTART